MRNKHSAMTGFSLVELLVVIGIISLLIGIALPAFSRAKEAVRKSTTSATINALATGIEQFRADQKFGGSYPPSYFCKSGSGIRVRSPYVEDGFVDIGGAGLIVWALAGADLLGTAGFRDLNHSDPGTGGVAPWADDTHALTPSGPTDPGGLYATQGSTPTQPRSSFVDPAKMKFSKKEQDSSGVYFSVPSAPATPRASQPMSPMFLDSFDQPILYYKANPGRPRMVCDLTPAEFFSASVVNTGTYNLTDNILVTGCQEHNIAGLDFGAGNLHFKKTLGGLAGPRAPGEENDLTFRNSFGWTVFNPSSTVWSPHNPETYILLSAGPDGLFGTPDDIANFETNQ